ncbi:MAG: FeoB-associated Cys-rich membrane protein [Clostridia bacterium]|nr:FeoB-associated Cys-rich membrane protein [Clostridia bacterium]
METVIAVAALLVIVCAAAGYVVRAKKKGQKCIGCPYAKSCSGHCSGK